MGLSTELNAKDSLTVTRQLKDYESYSLLSAKGKRYYIAHGPVQAVHLNI